MTEKEKLHFLTLQKELFICMTNPTEWDKKRIYEIMTEICITFRICKGETKFYQTPRHEMLNDGETLVCYDNGREGKPAVRIRFVSRTSAVVIGTAYMTDDVAPLSEEEYEYVYFALHTTLCLLSFNRLQRVVERLTFHDDFGFRNLRSFYTSLTKISDAGEIGRKTAVHYNLLHFSLVNRQIGKPAGDIVMRNHYEGLAEIIGDTGTVCRLGGDNFVAIFDQTKTDDVVCYLTETPVVYDPEQGKRIMVATSAGLYIIPEDAVINEPNEIMDKIVPASLAARAGGKERIVYYNNTLRSGKEKSMPVQQAFPEALRQEEFKVFYQPKINIEAGKLAGAEALCRWFHNGRLISPVDFIPILEETTEICKLDFYMLDHVCADIRRWLDEGRTVVRISVNLSRKHMMDGDLLTNILEIVDKHNVPHQYIEIELTETTTDVEFRDLKRVVRGLQKAGIYTSVDDFGIGYSSLNLIREIPWNVLKIDRSFLQMNSSGSDQSGKTMFKYVIAMAKELGLECIAEGVETEEQLELLRANHCGFAQGFLFDRPLCVEDFEDRLNGHDYAVTDTAQH